MYDSPTLGLKRKACFLQLPGTARGPFLFPVVELFRRNFKALAGKTILADLAYGQKNVRVNIPVVPMLRGLVHIHIRDPARGARDLPARVSEQIFALLLRKLPRKVDDDLLGNPYAIRLRDIAGIVAGPKVAPVPAVTLDLLGLAGIRGGVVPVFGLASILGYGQVQIGR